MDIAINKESVFDSIYRTTGYTGKTYGSMDGFSATTGDNDILAQYFNEGIVSVENFIYYGCTYKDGVFSLSLPSNWDGSFKIQLASSLEKYLENFVLFKWFCVIKKDENSLYADACLVAQNSINRYVSKRVKPEKGV